MYLMPYHSLDNDNIAMILIMHDHNIIIVWTMIMKP